MDILIAEIVGTAMLVLLGNGVVANHLLAESKGRGGGWMMICGAWGLAVALSAYSVGRVSGAHLNPALTLGLASTGQVPASEVVTYIVGQMIGAFLGATLVWLTYLPHWAKTEDPAEKLGCFSTAPAIRDTPSNLIAEFIGTFVLVFGILAIGANAGEMINGDFDLSAVFSTAINPLLVGLLVATIGMSLGGQTGWAINPARDLGPRIMHALLPIAGKGSSDWGYAWIPVVGPIAGGVCGALVFQALFG